MTFRENCPVQCGKLFVDVSSQGRRKTRDAKDAFLEYSSRQEERGLEDSTELRWECQSFVQHHRKKSGMGAQAHNRWP